MRVYWSPPRSRGVAFRKALSAQRSGAEEIINMFDRVDQLAALQIDGVPGEVAASARAVDAALKQLEGGVLHETEIVAIIDLAATIMRLLGTTCNDESNDEVSPW